MDRTELKQIIQRIIRRLREEAERDSAQPACVFNDSCDATTKYAVGEES